MNGPRLGEANLGALSGAVAGAMGGLFAVGIAPAIASGSIARLIGTPKLAFISFLICGVIGWLLGGQIGGRLGEAIKSQRAEIIGGGVGGLIPAVAIGLWSWYLISH